MSTRTTSTVGLADWQHDPDNGPNRIDVYRSVTAELSDDLSVVRRRAWAPHVRFHIQDLAEETSADLYLDRYDIAAMRAMLDVAEQALTAEPSSDIDEPELEETRWASMIVVDLDEHGAPGDFLLPGVPDAQVSRDLYSATVRAKAAGREFGATIDPATGTRWRGLLLRGDSPAEHGMGTPVDIQVEVRL